MPDKAYPKKPMPSDKKLNTKSSGYIMAKNGITIMFVKIDRKFIVPNIFDKNGKTPICAENVTAIPSAKRFGKNFDRMFDTCGISVKRANTHPNDIKNPISSADKGFIYKMIMPANPRAFKLS